MDKKKTTTTPRKPARDLTARKLTKKELSGAAGGIRIEITPTPGCCTQGCCD